MPKKICFVCHAYFPHHSPRKLRQTLALVESGYEVDLLCLRNAKEPRRERFERVNVYRVPVRKKRGSALRYLFEYAASFCAFLVLLSYLHLRKRYDAIHVYSLPDFMCFAALFPKRLGTKIILDNLDPMPEMYATKYRLSMDSRLIKLLAKIERASGAFADLVITQNHVYAAALENRAQYRRSVLPILNPPDPRYFGEIAPPRAHAAGDEITLLFHGTVSERYGLDVALKAMPLILSRRERVRLVIAGSGDYFEAIMDLIATLKLAAHVSYIGEKRVEEIPGVIQACTFGVIPPRSTVYNEINVPNRVFEYLWLGKAVIASRTRALLHYFPEDAMLYFNAGEAEDFAAKVLWALAHEGEVRASVRKGQEVCRRYGWEEQKKIYLQAVEELLREKYALKQEPVRSQHLPVASATPNRVLLEKTSLALGTNQKTSIAPSAREGSYRMTI
jgi:glycosyltransferase involved in cell wall biosynthesis